MAKRRIPMTPNATTVRVYTRKRCEHGKGWQWSEGSQGWHLWCSAPCDCEAPKAAPPAAKGVRCDGRTPEVTTTTEAQFEELVAAFQEIQKRNPPASAAWRAAHYGMRALVLEVKGVDIDADGMARGR